MIVLNLLFLPKGEKTVLTLGKSVKMFAIKILVPVKNIISHVGSGLCDRVVIYLHGIWETITDNQIFKTLLVVAWDNPFIPLQFILVHTLGYIPMSGNNG